MPRVKMPDGHIQLNLEGMVYNKDEEGCFTVPAHHVENLIRVHGAEIAPSVQEFEQRAVRAEEAVVMLTQQLIFAKTQAKTLRGEADAAKAKHTKALEKAAKDAEARATAAKAEETKLAEDTEADEAARAAAQAAAGSTVPGAKRGTIPRVSTG